MKKTSENLCYFTR